MCLRFKLVRSCALCCVGISQAVMCSAIITVKDSGFHALQIQQQIEKGSLTAAQKKIDSQLLFALKQKRGETRGVPVAPIELELDGKGRALVDINATVSSRLESQIQKLGGAIVFKDSRYRSIRAWLKLEKLEELASLKDVNFIAPAARAMNNRIGRTKPFRIRERESLK